MFVKMCMFVSVCKVCVAVCVGLCVCVKVVCACVGMVFERVVCAFVSGARRWCVRVIWVGTCV